jgi:hypothetical protein
MPTYPSAVKVFPTFHDYTDVIFAYSVNELHDEVISVENVLGTWTNGQVIDGTQYTTFSIAIQDLFNTKAPINHAHSHHLLGDLVTNSVTGQIEDDHLQYSRCDGQRPFTGPVAGVWASRDDQLVPLSQLLNFGYITIPQAEFLIGLAMSNLVTGAWGGPPTAGASPPAPTWRLTGGVTEGATDSAASGHHPGWLFTGFNNAFQHMVQGFVATKMPVSAGQGPYPPYNYIEAQLTLTYIDPYGCWCAFSHDYSFQPSVWAKYSWLAIGY